MRPALSAGWLAAGAAVGAVVAGAWLVGLGEADLVLVLLALAPVVLVPLGLDLHRTPTLRRQARAAVALGGLAALAVVVPRGPLAAALTGPWLVLAGVLALVGLLDWWRQDHTVFGLVCGPRRRRSSWLGQAGCSSTGSAPKSPASPPRSSS